MASSWSIGIYEGASPLTLAPAPGVKNPVLTGAEVSDAEALYVADPFLLRAEGSWHMFFEAFNGQTGKGEIALATSEDGRRWSYRQIVLAEPFHLSYPSVFEWDGDYYLLPESHQAGDVRLYRAERFPFDWSHVSTLLEHSPFVDPSIFRHDGRWWLFVETGSHHEGVEENYLRGRLGLYHADGLDGPWVEHVCSPVVEGDPSRSRPAGRVVLEQGSILRFAQDCSAVYGASVRAFEITELTPASYLEREVPGAPILGGSGRGWNAERMHHLDPCRIGPDRWLAAVDGFRGPGKARALGARLVRILSGRAGARTRARAAQAAARRPRS